MTLQMSRDCSAFYSRTHLLVRELVTAFTIAFVGLEISIEPPLVQHRQRSLKPISPSLLRAGVQSLVHYNCYMLLHGADNKL